MSSVNPQVVRQARTLWTAHHTARLELLRANYALEEVRNRTGKRGDEYRRAVDAQSAANRSFDSALADLRAFYANAFQHGLSVLNAYLAIKTQEAHDISDLALDQSWHESNRLSALDMELSKSSLEVHRAALELTQQKVAEAQAALDALTGERVN